MRDLVIIAYDLLDQEQERLSIKSNDLIEPRHDYSFVVFPMAKAFEGFLKKVLVDMDLAGEQMVYSHHFRIGKSLNPDLPIKYRRDDWLYGKIDEVFGRSGDNNLATDLWSVWKEGRNLLFHYFPDHQEFISLGEAGEMLERIVGVMERVVES